MPPTPATHTQTIPPLLPSRKASPPFGRYQLVLLGEQRHIGVRNVPRVFTSRARPILDLRPLDRKSDTLPTAPPSSMCIVLCQFECLAYLYHCNFVVFLRKIGELVKKFCSHPKKDVYDAKTRLLSHKSRKSVKRCDLCRCARQ